MEDFVTRLKRLMSEKKLNNSSLQRELGYKSPSTVQAWVKGKGMPELSAIPEVAKALGVTPSYLLHGVEEHEHTPNKVEEPMASYGISKDELVEFFQWKAAKANEKAEEAQKQVERLKSTEVDAK